LILSTGIGSCTAPTTSVRGPATDSPAKAVEVAGKLGPQGGRLAGVSKAAFLTAMHASTTVLAVIVAVAAVLIGPRAPGRDGHQLSPVRRSRLRSEVARRQLRVEDPPKTPRRARAGVSIRWSGVRNGEADDVETGGGAECRM
jgi:hypothetical protein